MYYQITGTDAADAPLVVMSSGLGGSADYWTPQLAALQSNHRVLVYDHLGTGRSPSKLPAGYSIKSMAEELSGLMDSLAVESCYFVGHALGGLVGLQMAIADPKRFLGMVLVNAWGSPNVHTRRCFEVRKSILAHCSPEIYLKTQALLLYPPDWIVENVETLENQEQRRVQDFPDRDNLLRRIDALCQFDVADRLSTVFVDTLLIANADDGLVPWRRSEALLNGLPEARLHRFEYGGHAGNLTDPDGFNEVLIRYLAERAMG